MFAYGDDWVGDEEYRLPGHLFYMQTNKTPLRAVVAANLSRAAALIGVHRSTMQRYGVQYDLDNMDGPEAIKEVLPRLMGEPGAVFELLDGRWRNVSGAANATRVESQLKRNIAARGPRVPGGRSAVRVLKLTQAEADALRRTGGARWLRGQIESPTAQPVSVDGKRRRTSETLIPMSLRINDTLWARFIALGGVAWLRSILQNLP